MAHGVRRFDRRCPAASNCSIAIPVIVAHAAAKVRATEGMEGEPDAAEGVAKSCRKDMWRVLINCLQQMWASKQHGFMSGCSGKARGADEVLRYEKCQIGRLYLMHFIFYRCKLGDMD